MADLGAIRTRLSNNLATISGLNTYPSFRSTFVLPASMVLIAPGQFLTEVTQDGAEDLDLVVLTLVKKVVDDVAQDSADDYASEGSLNVANAIDSGSTADWDYAVAGASSGYGEYVFGEGEQAQRYLGFETPVKIGVS